MSNVPPPEPRPGDMYISPVVASDHPFEEVINKANELIKQGHTLYQKWTCDACQDRVTTTEPNTFYTSGRHEDCKVDNMKVTDIRGKGCNYLLIMSLDEEGSL